MGYPLPPGPPWPPPPPPPWPPPKPPLNTGDLVGSVVLLMLTGLIGGAGALLGLLSLTFLDHCPPATCSVRGAVTVVMGTVGVVAMVCLSGLILAIVRLGTRRPAWPFALGALGLCVGALLLGGFAYSAAVG